MKNYIHYTAIAVLIMVFAGCSKNNDFQNENIGDGSDLLKSAGPTQFKITKASGALEFNYSPENVCYPYFAQNRNFGTGTASHFGKITLESVYCVNQQGGFESAWTGTITTANGDVIYFINEDPASTSTIDENWNAHVEFNIVGGTGRYTGATGFFYMNGIVNIPQQFWNVEGAGTINYKK
jgi:hypothetical protein